MKTRTAESVAQPSATAIITVNDHKTCVNYEERITRDGDARSAKSRQKPFNDLDASKTVQQDQNPHPAWNPDSRWSR
jgi:hypothetical protein